MALLLIHGRPTVTITAAAVYVVTLRAWECLIEGGNQRHVAPAGDLQALPDLSGSVRPVGAPLVVLIDHPPPGVGLTPIRRAGYAVRTIAPDWRAAEQAATLRPHLAVLSLDALGANGLPTVVELRQRSPLLPVVLVKRDAAAADRVQGLAAGADDFWPWPICSVELLARIEAILRRTLAVQPFPRSMVLRAGPMVLDEAARSVEIFGVPVQLTLREFDLLTFLLRHPRQALRREVLLRAVRNLSTRMRHRCAAITERWPPSPRAG